MRINGERVSGPCAYAAPIRRALAQLAPEQEASDETVAGIEELMRLQYSTLDHLSRPEFDAEVLVCLMALHMIAEQDAEADAEAHADMVETATGARPGVPWDAGTVVRQARENWHGGA